MLCWLLCWLVCWLLSWLLRRLLTRLLTRTTRFMTDDFNFSCKGKRSVEYFPCPGRRFVPELILRVGEDHRLVPGLDLPELHAPLVRLLVLVPVPRVLFSCRLVPYHMTVRVLPGRVGGQHPKLAVAPVRLDRAGHQQFAALLSRLMTWLLCWLLCRRKVINEVENIIITIASR